MPATVHWKATPGNSPGEFMFALSDAGVAANLCDACSNPIVRVFSIVVFAVRFLQVARQYRVLVNILKSSSGDFPWQRLVWYIPFSFIWLLVVSSPQGLYKWLSGIQTRTSRYISAMNTFSETSPLIFAFGGGVPNYVLLVRVIGEGMSRVAWKCT